MMHLKLDIWPWGQDGMAFCITELFIANTTADGANSYSYQDENGHNKFGDYDVWSVDPRESMGRSSDKPGWICHLEKIPRDVGIGPLMSAISEHLNAQHGEMSGAYTPQRTRLVKTRVACEAALNHDNGDCRWRGYRKLRPEGHLGVLDKQCPKCGGEVYQDRED